MIRIAPVLLLKNGSLVRSTLFGRHQVDGDPFLQCKRFNSWLIDELIYLDISDDSSWSTSRSDTANRRALGLQEVQQFVAADCLVPLVWGGRLRTFADAAGAIARGADKVVFTTALESNPEAVRATAVRFGEQAVCVGVDYRLEGGRHIIFVEDGRRRVETSIEDWIDRAVDHGAGEILLHAIDRDGRGSGYDLVTLERIQARTNLPLTLLGGARSPSHLAEAALGGASAVAAANMWHFSDNVDHAVRKSMDDLGIRVRRV